ncbi:hypothetical protein GCM10027184_10460 [Saccharothrix stipae]
MTRARDAAPVLSKALALHLHALGLVRYPPNAAGTAVPCYVEDFPLDTAPDDLVLIRSQQGFPSLDVSGYESPELEIMRRTSASAGVQAGYDGAEALRRAVDGTGEVTWAAGTEHEVDVARCDANEARPTRKGSDPKGRPVWSCSVTVDCLEASA